MFFISIVNYSSDALYTLCQWWLYSCCRMMGFRGGACAVTNARFGQGPRASPIWITYARCNGREDCLGECTFTGLDDPITSCSHQEDAGVVCLSGENLTLTSCKYTLSYYGLI